MPNLENFLTYEHWQYEIIRILLTLTVAIFLAGLFYFLLTAKESTPRYRLSSIISSVVMVSAVLEIGQLLLVWSTSFTHSSDLRQWQPAEGQVFSNGFRYVNWTIDVPMLLTQLLVVLGLVGAPFWREWWKLAVAGVLMIWTGLIGQFYEPAVSGLEPGAPVWPFWFWGIVSTLFYIYLLYKVATLIYRPPEPLDDASARLLRACWWIVLISWTLYPVAYILPAVWATADGMVVRQAVFTVADISSKLLFGVLLSWAARKRSKAIGYVPALEAEGETSTSKA